MNKPRICQNTTCQFAVGVIGEPDNLPNLMYAGVFVAGMVCIITAVAGLGFPTTPPQSLSS